ncbi:Phospholipase ytpA [Actinomyces howellii]|uniref:Phospholipase ytpA n=1 Tax=Actinomyces howellii TaxID=52771 RepID=A0A448HJ60_9ACTO|nr:Phospholipase ytpA [Actinomyces howellii]
MQVSVTQLPGRDGAALTVRSWLPDGVSALGDASQDAGPLPRAIIQVAHGMAEHSARYGRFAEAAVARGHAVVAHDHRGHGASAHDGLLGHVADSGGWDLVLADLEEVLDVVLRTWPGVPVVLMGHSWGSFLVRLAAARRGADLAGMIVLGTGGDPGAVGVVGQALGALTVRVRGARATSPGLDRLVFARYNAGLRPRRTRFDWLSRDPQEVDAYLSDPWCGFVSSAAFYRDLAGGVRDVARPQVVEATPSTLPVLVMSGDRDPVGARGRGPREVARAYRRAGSGDVSLRLHRGARHELLNESNREEVTAEILDWVDART